MRYFFHILIFIFFSSSLSAQVTGLSGWNIFLDPGHSRTENMGVYGYSEAERNVRVALRLRDLLLNTIQALSSYTFIIKGVFTSLFS